jgi:hypothetical protein
LCTSQKAARAAADRQTLLRTGALAGREDGQVQGDFLQEFSSLDKVPDKSIVLQYYEK